MKSLFYDAMHVFKNIPHLRKSLDLFTLKQSEQILYRIDDLAGSELVEYDAARD